MFEKIFKLNKEQANLMKLTVRPFLICCLIIGIMLCIGSYYKTMPIAEVNGFTKGLLIYFIINHINILWFEMDKNTKINNGEDNNEQ